jgi:large repetitive protein
MHKRFSILRAAGLLLWLAFAGNSTALSIDVPTLVSPANGATGQPVALTLTWNAVAFADSYRVQVSVDSLFTQVVTEASVAHISSSVQSTSVGPLLNDSLHYWRVRARDNTGTFGAWSTRWRFRTVANLPGIPLLAYPASGATGIALTDSLKWNADALADAYRVQVSSGTSFTVATIVFDTTVAVAWGNSMQGVRLRGLANKTKYYWRARSHRGSDTSSWASSWNFTTIVDTPSLPLLLTPTDGAKSQPVSPTVLTWSTSTDAATYRLQVATDAAFTALVVNDSTLTSTNKQVAGLLTNTTYYWRVTAKNAAATTAFTAPRSFSTKLATPSAVSPLNNSTGQPIEISLQWSASPGANLYRAQLSTSSTFTSLLQNVSTAELTLSLTGLQNKTKYYWRVSALGASGDTSLYPTTPYNFTTIVDTPSAPSMTSPTNAARSVALNPTTFTWGTVTDASTYRLQVATDSLFAGIVAEDSTLSNTSKGVSGLLVSTRYFWRVNAKNAAGTSPYSAVWSLTTRPTVPGILSPATNATGQSTSPVLKWSTAADIVATRVQVSTATSFSPMVVSQTVAADSIALGPLATKTKYYWRLSAQNANGDTSAFPATPWNFTTLVGIPGIPSLTAPAANATSQAINPTAFSWASTTDAATYHLQVALDSSFVALVFQDSMLSSASKQVPGLLTATRYYWHVRSRNAAGASEYSGVRTFTTALVAPAVLSPALSATDQSTTPVLRWSQTAGATQYLVQVARGATFKPYITQVIVAAESVQVGPLGNDSTYYWHVSARNANGDTSAYPATAWSFRTRLATPELVLPVNGAGGQPVNPTLSWNAVPGASYYRLQVSDDPGFPGTVIFDDAAITITSRQIGPLNGSKTYFWRVNARNVGGTSTSLWSPTRSFTTRIDTPTAPVLLAPLNGAVDVGFTPTLQWNQASSAAFYTVQMSFDSLFRTLMYERTPLITLTHNVGPLVPDTVYYWRVCSINQNGSATSAFTSPWHFRTRLDTPSVPTLLSPPSKAMAQPVTSTLRWNSARAASSYRIQVSTDSYFPNVIFDTTVVRDTSVMIGPMLQNGNSIVNNATYYWRVMSLNRLGTSNFSLPYNFTTIIAAPSLTAPENNAADQVARNLPFSWSPVAGARTYGFLLASDSAFTIIAKRETLLTATTFIVDSLDVSSRYHWKVVARSDSNGTTSSPRWTFTTLITVPAVPQLVTPVSGATNMPTTVTFTWGAAIGANSYRLQIASDSTFASVLYDFPALNTTAYQMQSLAYNTRYYWRVSASNGNGSSPFSHIWHLTITVPAPSTPYLNSPADGAVDVPLPAQLVWNQTAGAETYRLRISAVPDFSSIAFDTTTTQNSATILGISAGAKYYWQVTAQNGGGSRTSSIWSFTTRLNPPTPVLLASPSDEATNIPPSPILAWTGGAGASGYHLQVARDSLFLLIVLDDSTVSTPSRTIGPLAGLTRYYWRVRAYNIGGLTPFTAPWTFRTVIDMPIPASPLAASMHVPNPPTLRWHPVNGDTRYRVQVAKDPAFTSIAVDAGSIIDTLYRTMTLTGFTRYYWRVSAQSADGTSIGDYSAARYFTTALDTVILVSPPDNVGERPTTNTFIWRRTGFAETYRFEIAAGDSFTAPVFIDSLATDTSRTVGPMPGLTSYIWRVRAQNAADTGSFSRPRTFRTTIGTPVLVSPVNGYAKVPINAQLTWAPVPGAARYRVQVASDSAMTALLVDDSLVASSTYTTTALERLSRYYWRVRAKTADGLSIGAFSGVWSFVTVPIPPLATTLLSPADGLLNVSRTPLIKWRAATRAESYGLQIATDTSFTLCAVNDSTVHDTAYQPPALAGLQKFYWRVRSINPGGSSVYTPRWSFTTVIATPTPLLPAQAAPDQMPNLRLVWSSVSRASTYRVQLSSDSLMRSFVLDDSTLVDTVRQVSGLARSTLYYWRVRAKAAAGISTSQYSAIQTFVTVIDTPAVPVPAAPLQAARNVPIVPVLAWRPSARAAQYRVQVAADSLFEFVVFQDTSVVDTARQLQTLDNFATYYWRIRAVNLGGMSPYSSTRRFQTAIDTPLTTSPVNFAEGQNTSPMFRWTGVAGASRFRLVVSADSLLRNPVFEDSLITTNARTVGGLFNSTTYFWRVQGRSADGVSVSPHSAIARFTTVVDTPAQVVLGVPADSGKAGATSARLLWSVTERANAYHLQVSTDSLFHGFVVNDSTLTDTSYAVASLTPHTVYWWRVRGRNPAGYGPYSLKRHFTTLIGTPIPYVPADSTADLTSPVTLRWFSATGASGYHVQVGLDSLFAQVVFEDTVATGLVVDLLGLEPFMKYYWHVRALDSLGGGEFSAVRWFMTQLVPPRAPVQVTPTSGLTAAMTNQVFRWRPTRMADRYELQISLDSPFDSTVFVNSAIVDTFCTVQSLLNNTRYFWRVRGVNVKGPGAFSDVWSLTTIVASPVVPVLVTPASGSNDLGPFVTLLWRSSPHAVSYHLQVSTDAPFGSTVFEDSAMTDTVKKVGPLDYSRTYYWRVCAQNSGWITDWSSVRSMTIMNPPVTFDLYQNYPNPCNPSTMIRYDIPVESEVSLILYDLLGQQVRKVVDDIQKTGRYDVLVDVGGLPSGVFIYRLVTRPVPGPSQPVVDPRSWTKKLMILR